MKNFTLTLLLGALSFLGFSQAVNLEIQNLRNDKGQLHIGIFKTAEQFDKENPIKEVLVEKNRVSNGKINIKINLEPGTYGITVLDDEDKSEDMTYRFGVYPLEGVGFSNYVLSGLSKPDFKDFSFMVNKSTKIVSVKMKYF